MNSVLSFKKIVTADFNRILTRSFKSDLKIKWVRPEKILSYKPEKSGDVKLTPIDPKKTLLKFEGSQELESADDTVKSLFSLEKNRKKYTADVYRQQFLEKVQRHRLDYGSMEARLGKMTADIRILQEQMEEFPRNKQTKIHLQELIDKRKKFLKYLRRWDYKRFEYILEQLDLVYKPPPDRFHWITRKESLRKLTDIHCENVKNERLETYKKSLQVQQLDFLQNKIKNLELIRTEQSELKAPLTVSEKDIQAVREQFDKLKIARLAEAPKIAN